MANPIPIASRKLYRVIFVITYDTVKIKELS